MAINAAKYLMSHDQLTWDKIFELITSAEIDEQTQQTSVLSSSNSTTTLYTNNDNNRARPRNNRPYHNK